MASSLLIPKRKVEKLVRPGGGGDFWNKFWQSFNSSATYSKKIRTIQKFVNPLSNLDVPTDKKLYAEITLSEKAVKKSNKPTELWKNTNLDVVDSKNDRTFTVSGKKSDFKKLEQILLGSSFVAAKSGTEVSRKDKNIYREIFAIDKIEDQNLSLEKRVSRDVLKLINEDSRDTIDCIVEIYQNQKISEYDQLYELLKDELSEEKIHKRNPKFFIGNMSFRGELRINEIKNILGNLQFNFISKIKLYPYLVGQRCIPNLNMGNLTIGEPLTSERIAVFDSGIDHAALNGLVDRQRYNYTRGKSEDKNHGTFVASRLLFGDDIFVQANGSATLTPIGQVMDIQVLYKRIDGRTTVDPDSLKEAITTIVERHSDISIFNLSIADENQIDETAIDELTQFLDVICRKNDIIFVCAVGNHSCFKISPYDRLFSDASLDTRIASPADALNVISVGSIANKISENTICPTVNFPSPFTRKGGIRQDWKKPELVIGGGNIQLDTSNHYDDTFMVASSNNYGVEGVNTAGLHKDIGTSFSAPLITRQCAHLLDFIKKSNLQSFLSLKNNKANLVKALLIHSTSKQNQTVISDENIKKAYGFGIPDSKKVIKDVQDHVSIVYCDTVNYGNRKQTLQFQLPNYLLNKPVDFIFTFVYNPPVDKNFPDEYKMITLQPALRLAYPHVDDRGNVVGTKYKNIGPKHSWENYKTNKYNVTHYKKSVKKLTSLNLEFLVQMAASEHYESLFIDREEENIFQSYSLVLTIIDKTEGNRLREEVLNTNQFEELIENVVRVEV